MHLSTALLVLPAALVAADPHKYCICTTDFTVKYPGYSHTYPVRGYAITADLAKKYPGWIKIYNDGTYGEISYSYTGWAHNVDDNGIIGGDAFHGACVAIGAAGSWCDSLNNAMAAVAPGCTATGCDLP
ncbi:hypothetical protein N7499_003279 [Penicillium canescens]|uniref:Uncharacterized protein n=1 Tax=Penicillium canescens TaxID=5083 RepID=A0AAD6I5I2_PENCN|nr:uncharacterized protein N7446_014045 [Penicillium canescens]KAJ6018523.1 hypothetical protein N7522_001987 [Penicillium canescens]KAJ6034129.1 hypothetical protein N7460_009946 [Penicillium canescens]KAJ6039297.1 hypothetical protein N7446_014045 [Penicillium canescens]KAJ6066138.1 hypothetical protein N7444_000267 [Penicillium canescens]KAJ6091128.1 hypothetical protein N7499_003279 [Penicillium canescens]